MDSNHASFRVGHIPCPPIPWLFFRKDWFVPVSVSWISAPMTRSSGNSLLTLQIRQPVFWAALEGPGEVFIPTYLALVRQHPSAGSSSKGGDSSLAASGCDCRLSLLLHALQWALLFALSWRSMRLFCRLCKGLCFLSSCCFLIFIPYLSPFQPPRARAQMVQAVALLFC